MEQPNVNSDGDASLTGKFWIMVVVAGVAAGLVGDAMMAVLFTVQRLAFGSAKRGYESNALSHSAGDRFALVLLAGAIGGVAWYLLRRRWGDRPTEVDDAIWRGDGKLSWFASLATSVISEVVIGLGASLGREAAPKLMGGASASVLGDYAKLTSAQRRLLVACGAGGAFAAVYNVPLGGALFTAEILIGSLSLPVILPTVACSFIATVTSWLCLPTHPTYVNIPSYAYSGRLLVWALVAGVVIGLVAVGYIRLVGWVSFHKVRGPWTIVGPLGAFAVLGIVGIAYPQLFGNGQDMAHDAFLGRGGLVLLAALFALKPLVTALCLGGGASGGLFTPVMSTGAVLGGFLGLAWSHVWPGSPVGAYAMIGAAAMIGAGMQAPLAALAIVLELTQSNFSLMVPMMAATVIATAVSRQIDGYSIYSARLPAGATAAPASG